MCLKRRMNFASPTEEIATLKALLAQTQAALAESEEARRRLESIVSELQREKFGAKSEKLSPDQYNLPLEDVEIAQGVLDAAQEKAEATINGQSQGKARPRNRNRGQLPAHLPRVERVIEPESTLCPCGCGEMAKIGEDVSGRLNVIPAQFRVLITRRPRYACRRCAGAVVQAHAPEHVVPGGLPTEALSARVIVAKFGDHLPFYRQADIYARQGIRLDRASLGNWAGRACFHLQPIAAQMRQHLAAADRLFTDETTSPVLDPGRLRTKKGFSGPSPRTTGAMAAPAHPSCCSATRPDAAACMPSGSCRASAGGSCNATATTAMSCSPAPSGPRGRGRWGTAEAICGGASSSSCAPRSLPSPRPPSGISLPSTPSRPPCAGRSRRFGSRLAGSIRPRSSPPRSPGSRSNCR